jgi:peptide/nickel transport system ATP-binding protein
MLSPLRLAGTQVADGARDGLAEAELARRLEEVGIRDPSVAWRYPFELSGGLRQRVGIAAALAGDPELLVADEPSTALDVTTQRKVLRLLAHLRSTRDLALVLITHDLRVAFAVCDRVYVLYAGALLEVSEAAAIERAPLHPYTSALLRCEPTADRRLAQLEFIPGSVPRADAVLDRCAFEARCPHAEPRCRAGRPRLVERSPGRLTACVRIDELADRLRIEARAGSDEVAGVSDERVLVATGVRKTFAGRRGRADVAALRGVSLEVRAGESVGVVGESGSGKTTLARIVAGLETADEGSIRLAGRAARPARGPSPVQVVFQDPTATLNPARRVGATLADALRLAGRDHGAAAVDCLLAEVGLPGEYARRKPLALSGGERQRVAIARALAPRPSLLLCDEPVSSLDVSVQAQVLEVFRRLRDRLSLALVFITHDLGVVRQVADRIYVLCDGEVVEEGPVARVLDEPQHSYTHELVDSVPRSGRGWLAAESAVGRP